MNKRQLDPSLEQKKAAYTKHIVRDDIVEQSIAAVDGLLGLDGTPWNRDLVLRILLRDRQGTQILDKLDQAA